MYIKRYLKAMPISSLQNAVSHNTHVPKILSPKILQEPPIGGVYVHWPYCAALCTYCDFNKYVSKDVDHTRMEKCLVAEANFMLRTSRKLNIGSIFFGGGTPSLAHARTVEAVIQEILMNEKSSSSACEITLEANPTSATKNRLLDFRAAGINRISLGVQSLNDIDLKLLGRDHNTAEALTIVDEAERIFPGATNVDIMIGRPGQTLATLTEELRILVGKGVSHISVYELTLKAGTPLFQAHKAGHVRMPPNEAMYDFYQCTIEVLSNAGLNQYEVSNFAKPGAACIHNKIYWACQDYLGIGPGAHGRFTNRIRNTREHRVQTRHPLSWMQEVEAKGHGTRKREELSQDSLLEEVMMMGLRQNTGILNHTWQTLTNGISVSETFASCPFYHVAIEKNLLISDELGLRATQKGLVLLDSILPHLLQGCQKHI